MSLKIDEMEEKVILEKLLGSNGGAGDPNLLSEAGASQTYDTPSMHLRKF